MNPERRTLCIFPAIAILGLVLLEGCVSGSQSSTSMSTAVGETTEVPASGSGAGPAITTTPAEAERTGVSASEIIVYASDLLPADLCELDFNADSASPNGKFIGLPNTGDELDPPPENDPHVTCKVKVQGGIPYRCWIHMKVGAPKGRSQANVVWVQFSDAVDKSNREILKPGTGSYLTAQGPTQEGWTWVGCDLTEDVSSENWIYFGVDGEVTVRLQAGAEGVGFDQFLLSAERFLNEPPSEVIVGK